MADAPSLLQEPGEQTDQSPPVGRSRLRIAGWIAALFLGLFLLAVVWLAITAPLSRSLKPYAPPILALEAADGELIARKGVWVLDPVTLAELPPHVPQAFIAIEDRRFRSHWGVDPRGIARAAWHNMWAGGVEQGGSTITQQLAKGAFLSAERNFGRKAREVLIAFWLEAWLTKDEILERYLSNSYFGDNCYGLRAAARHYYNRTPADLTVAQAAQLAALLKAPSRLAPTSAPDAAWERAQIVLDAMVRENYLTSLERAGATRPRLRIRPVPETTGGGYFADWVLAEARDRSGDGYGEHRVRTTLDSRVQRIVERAVRRAPLGSAQVAVVVMRPTGEVIAMQGGKSHARSAFNRATQARRPAGSTFKLFVYLAVLRSGMSPDDSVFDTPITSGDYRPRNHDERYRGEITLLQAFAHSSNVAAARLVRQVGEDAVVQAARDLGVLSPLTRSPAIALGASGMTLLETAQAYAAIAAGRYPVAAYGLPVEQSPGLMAWLFDRQRRFAPAELDDLRMMLRTVIERGTGRSAALPVTAHGKTGTSQDNRDALFVGYANDLVTAVWVGNDDNSPINGLTGSGMPARIWRNIMMDALRLRRAVPVAPPDDDNAAEPLLEAEAGNFAIAIDNSGITLNGPGLQIDLPVAEPPAPAAPSAPSPDMAPAGQ